MSAIEQLLELASSPGMGERMKMASQGLALKDGSFPIPDKEHLDAAIKAYPGKNNDPAVVKEHIIKRAKALGCENMLPDSWTGGGSDKVAASALDTMVAMAADRGLVEDDAVVLARVNGPRGHFKREERAGQDRRAADRRQGDRRRGAASAEEGGSQGA